MPGALKAVIVLWRGIEHQGLWCLGAGLSACLLCPRGTFSNSSGERIVGYGMVEGTEVDAEVSGCCAATMQGQACVRCVRRAGSPMSQVRSEKALNGYEALSAVAWH
jgi:hypothetical protein